jgi:hypothetical protein
MQPERVFFLVHIHTSKMDYYALRDSLENAQEEVFQHAQGNWTTQFPGVERPSSKTEVVERYYQAVRNSVYFHVIDIEPEGNWVMEDINQPNVVPKTYN